MANKFITGKEFAKRMCAEIKNQAEKHGIPEIELYRAFAKSWQTSMGKFPVKESK